MSEHRVETVRLEHCDRPSINHPGPIGDVYVAYCSCGYDMGGYTSAVAAATACEEHVEAAR